MTNILVLGGNGYIGSNIIHYWMEKDNDAQFYVLSRSGNAMASNRVHTIKGDVHQLLQLADKMPQTIDYIVNCVGKPESTEQKDQLNNVRPAEIALQFAKEQKVKGIGFVQGALGPKHFVQTKASIANMYLNSGLKVSITNPTLVYGNGRKDALSKLVPIFKFLGLFAKSLKPVKVTTVAEELVDPFLSLK